MTEQQKNHIIHLILSGGFYKKKQFRKIFNDYIKTGEDLFELLYEINLKRSFGQTVKKSVLNWIYTNPPKFIEKELCSSFKGYDGLTILRLFHPKPVTKSYQKAFQNIKEYCLVKRKK